METTHQKINTLPIMIWFEGENLRIDIDHIPETFDWAKKQIENDKEYCYWTYTKFVFGLCCD